jgi:hypothetical protein
MPVNTIRRPRLTTPQYMITTKNTVQAMTKGAVMRVFEITKVVGPYRPFFLSLLKAARSSRTVQQGSVQGNRSLPPRLTCRNAGYTHKPQESNLQHVLTQNVLHHVPPFNAHSPNKSARKDGR